MRTKLKDRYWHWVGE